MAVIACEAGIGRGGGARKCDRKKGAGTEEGTPLPSPPIFLSPPPASPITPASK